MPLSESMLQFQRALRNHDTGAALHLLNQHPELTHSHQTDQQGHFVTALDQSMASGNVAVVERLLCLGAPLDLTIGAPPSRWEGDTVMTYALSDRFARTANADAIRAELAAQHFLRTSVDELKPTLEKFREASVEVLSRSAREMQLVFIHPSYEELAQRSLDLRHKHAQEQLLYEGQCYFANIGSEETDTEVSDRP